ncbi:MAG: hypothetical protein JXQ73_26190 [Phycisphaerae bacterium]|nr:hypothetical protein [Phycisphaerae bacterium]
MRGHRGAVAAFGSIFCIAILGLAWAIAGCGTFIPNDVTPQPPGDDDTVIAGEVVDADPNDLTGGDPNIPGDPNDGTTQAALPTANSARVFVLIGTPTPILLAGSDANGKQLTFDIVSGPASGTLSEIGSGNNGQTASVTYTPAPKFTGQDTFRFTTSNAAGTSEPATITVVVYPPLTFSVNPVTGHRPLEVTCTGPSAEGLNLPDVTYIWKFGELEDAGPMATHAQRTHVFKTAGVYAVTLSISIAGLTPIACINLQTNTPEGLVTVGPHIIGRVKDAQGKGIQGITVFANPPSQDYPEGSTTQTDAEGRYVVAVDYAWSGTVTPQHFSYTFDRLNRGYTNIQQDIENQDFVATSKGATISGRVLLNGQTPLAGVAVQGQGTDGSTGQNATATTDGQGQYAIVVTYGWSGTVTAALSGYTIAPAPMSVSNLYDDLEQDFVAVLADTPVIAGRIVDTSGQGIAGVTVMATNDGGSATTDANGYYHIPVNPSWSGAIEPSRAGYTFSPAYKCYTNVVANWLSEGFTGATSASPDAVVISGFIVNTAGNGVSGVSLSATNGGGSAATDQNGHYQLVVDQAWSGVVTPSHAEYTFSPTYKTYNDIPSNCGGECYTALSSADTIVIAGYVRTGGGSGVSGVTMNASNGGGTASTTSTGHYVLLVPRGWSGAVTPTRGGYSFSPTSKSYSDVTSDKQTEDYTATVLNNPVTLSGRVRNISDQGVSGVTLTATNGGGSAVTNASGDYQLTVSSAWSGTITPSFDGYRFAPGSASYQSLSANQTDQDYRCGPIGASPIAFAGPDQVAGLGTYVFLDGSKSVDHNGGSSLTYEWTKTSGPAITLISAGSAKAKFLAPDGAVDDTFAFAFRLTVRDTTNQITQNDTVNISIQLTKQSVLSRIHRAANGHYDIAVKFPDGHGGQYVGWAEKRTVDAGTQYYANEAGTFAEEGPTFTIQPPATPSVAYVYACAYAVTGNKQYLAMAESVADTLLAIQDAWNGGWHQDLFYEQGEWRYAMTWAEVRHDYTTDPHNQGIVGVQGGAVTLDDGTSQAAALFLLRLYQAGAGPQYLAGAKRFGDVLVDLKDVQDPETGQFPYRNGGIPQVMPLDVAMQIVFTGQEGTPGLHYYVHKTINDFTMQQAMLFLMDLYEETGDTRYRDAIRLNIDYLIGRHAAYGSRGWCQQYHYLTDEPAWGRHKEPPAFVSGEDGIIDMMLAWWERETDAARKQSIENTIHAALMYWKHEALRVDPAEPDPAKWQWWRYYNVPRTGLPNTNPGLDGQPINKVIFSDEYVNYYGVESEGHAAPGQPWKLADPRRWILRILDGSDNLDLSELYKYRGYYKTDSIFALGGKALATVYAEQNAEGLWTKTCNIYGTNRTVATAGTNADYMCALVDALDDVTGPITDSDSDGYSDTDEVTAGSDPRDSRSVPQ